MPTRDSPNPPPDEPKTGRDLRESTRIPFNVEVDLESEHNFWSGFTTNISEGGLFVSTYQVQPVGTELTLKLTLADHGSVSLHGVVVWLRDVDVDTSEVPPGMGIKFTKLHPKVRKAIDAYMQEERSPMFYDDEDD